MANLPAIPLLKDAMREGCLLKCKTLSQAASTLPVVNEVNSRISCIMGRKKPNTTVIRVEWFDRKRGD